MRRKILQVPGWVTAPQAAEMMGVRLDYLSRLVRMGALPDPVFVGDASGSRLFKEVDIRRYIDEHPRLGTLRKENLVEA